MNETSKCQHCGNDVTWMTFPDWSKGFGHVPNGSTECPTVSREADLLELISAIGGGFHPDTRGDDYEFLPDGVTPESYEAIVDAAFDVGLDVYGITLDAIHALDAAATS